MTEQLIKYWNLQESNRTNLVREKETERANRAANALGYAQLQAQKEYNNAYLAELARHNSAMELAQNVSAGAKVGDTAVRAFSLFSHPAAATAAATAAKSASVPIKAAAGAVVSGARALDSAIMSGLSAAAVPFVYTTAPLAVAGSTALMVGAVKEAVNPYNWSPTTIVNKKKAGDYSSVTYDNGEVREIYTLTPSERDSVKEWWDNKLGYEGAYEEQVLRVNPNAH